MAEAEPPEPDKLYNDNKVILKLFEALRTAIPPDVRLNMVQRCSEELKFIAAVQPRVSSFSARQRHSLRHPALSMATKRYYCSYRQRHAAQLLAEQNSGEMALPNYSAAETSPQRGRPSVSHVSRSSIRSAAPAANDEGWSEFGMGISNATWNFGRASQSAITVNMGAYQWPPRGSTAAVHESLRPGMTVLQSSNSLVRAVEEQDSAGSLQGRSDAALRSRIKGLLLGYPVGDDSSSELLKGLPIKQVTHRSRATDDLLDPEEEQQFLLFQQNEDFRWDQLSFCYDQMLRAAASVVRPAAVRAATDARVNDIIRRFWERLTVSPAAREAKRAEDERRAAAEAAGFNGQGEEDTTPKNGAAATSSAGGAGSPPRLASRAKPKKKNANKKKKLEALAATASYMTPLQYIYLNMRISSILLPTCRELEMEMLEAVQEDLLVDVTYREDDPKQTLYFGKAPVLIQPEGVTLQRPPSSNLLFDTARRRSNTERPDWKHNAWMSDESSSACEGSSPNKESRSDGLDSHTSDAIATWDPTRLPHLSYAQFWMSMLELTDNWTSTAANPAEYAIFLMELYMEVFGQDWSEEDAAFTRVLQSSLSQQQLDQADDFSRAQCVAEALEEFHAVMDEINDSFSASSESSSSTSGHPSLFSSSSGGAFRSPSASDGDEDSSDNDDDDDDSVESSLNSLFDDMDADGSPWEFLERVGPDGKVHRFRRKKILVPSKTRRKIGADGKEGENDTSTWMIEEELDEKGNVVRRRRLHRRHDSDDDETDADSKKKKKKRKNRHGSGGDGASLSGSWSSYEDRLDEKGRRTNTISMRKKEERARRKSTKKKKRQNGSDEGDIKVRKRKGSDGDGKNGARKKSRRSKKDENGVLISESDLESGADDDEASTGTGKKRKPLTEEQRNELLERKQWLQQMLAAQGIHIRDDAFLDHKEEGLLYELLKTMERMESQKKNGGAGRADGEGGAESDDTANAFIDVGLLAELLSRPSVFSIEDLGKSALMSKLLEANESDLRAVLPPEQMENVIAALLRPASRGAQETATMRRRRQKLLEDARLLRMHAEENDNASAEKEQQPEQQPQETKDTFDLTEVDNAKTAAEETSSRPTSSAAKRPKHPVEAAADGKPCTNMTTTSFSGSRPTSASRARTPPASPNILRPKDLTEEQLREQERLFREFEEFTAQQAEEESTYKVSFAEYTPEQLEAFFRHLHLGPQQQALLRGRAPLASATSLQGGTYHQLPSLGISRNMRVQMGFQLGASMAQVSRKVDAQQPYVPVKAAPVKLFTLTSQDTLQGAIRESYHSYLDDRAYQLSLQHARGLKGRPPKSTEHVVHPADERNGGSGGEPPRLGRGFNFKKDETAPQEGSGSAPPAPSLSAKDPLPPLGTRDAAKDNTS